MFLLLLTVNCLFLSISFSLCVVHASDSAGVSTPSVPEFSVIFVDNSYDVPSVYRTDSYTGETIVTEEDYHIQSKTIELVIKNPTTPFNEVSNDSLGLFYRVRLKGHFADSWRYPDYCSYPQYDDKENRVNFRGANPDSEYSTITYGLVGNNGTQNFFNLDVSEGGQIDFQVQALIGYRTRVNGTFLPGAPSSDPTDPIPHYYIFTGKTSEWSEIQTLTVPKTDSEIIPEEPITDELESTNEWLTQFNQIATILGVVVILVVLLLLIKKSRSNRK